ncbi:MAG: A24 family peptidase [Myxococcota bacterium]|nr:A24 family peptidase [Myxococcota bacterium]
MGAEHAVWSIPITAGLLVASWSDIATRRIPNKITISLLGVGLALALSGYGRVSVLDCLGAVGVSFATMLLPFIIRLYKGGDLKLVVASSAWLTPVEAFWSILLGVILGGILGMLVLFRNKQARESFKSTAWLALNSRYVDGDALHTSDRTRTVPMAVAFSVSVLATLELGVPWVT